MELYVSLAGNDSWSGSLAVPNTAGTDGPLRTLEAAQAAARRLKAGLTAQAEIKVWVGGGVYELSKPWLFTAQDSGFPRQAADWAQTWPITWAAYPGETPVISGGRRIGGPWRQQKVNGRKAWVTDLPQVAAGKWRFSQLWVNGQRRLRPRLPKQGVWQVERALDACYVGAYGTTIRQGTRRFGYAPGQIRADWRNLRDIEVQFFAWWVAPRAHLSDVDEAERVAWFDRDSTIRLAWTETEGVDFRLENIFEALTEPGEWYLDRPTGKLYYIPLPGEDIATAEVVAPHLQSLLLLEGATNIRFDGLTFAHAEWKAPAHFADSNQASWEVPGAVVVHHGDTCVFRGCRVLHTNGYGVEINHGSIEVGLERCELRDLGAGGVRIWHGCRRNVVTDCEIADGGHVYPAGVGVLIGRSTGNRVEYNHIHDFYYSGVSAGWNWGYAESDGYGNLIEWNHIHDIGKGLLSDMGGIYLLGHAAGTRLRYNHIHDIACRRYGGWCMYTDEGSSEVLMESNVCYNANREPFHQHYGRNNLVRNNILAYGGDALIAYSKPEAHVGLVFESNILLSRDKPILCGAGSGARWRPDQAEFRRNLYWCETGKLDFRGGVGMDIFATQSFPNGFKAEAPRFAALGEVPATAAPPREATWKKAKSVTRFVPVTGTAAAPTGTADLRFLCEGDTLHLRATFRCPEACLAATGLLWHRAHIEIFLKPFADRPGMVQLGLAADGETAAIWHDCAPPAGYAFEAQARTCKGGWQATLRIPLAAIVTAAAGTGCPAWSFLAGFATLLQTEDWPMWHANHDPEGVNADPLFVDPAHGDFRLRPNSPALALGFIPFDVTQCGPRH